MNKTIRIPVSEVTPSQDAILQAQGIPAGVEIKTQVIKSAKTALQLYTELAVPLGMLFEISHAEFEPIYNGIGLNSNPGLIEEIYKKSKYMALFAVTIGPVVGTKIRELFHKSEFALGSFLDSAASCGADLISHVLEAQFKKYLSRHDLAASDMEVLAYSPGYCGWHISAQRALFDYLHPDEIGISLRDSFLMEPLKSISGVLLAGPREIHIFDDVYSFCTDCKSRSCRDRVSALTAK
jgi:hypothetical protein